MSPQPPGVAASEIRQQLERILASRRFVRAESLSRFLRFAVERTLEGNTDQLKEVLLGTVVFDRPADFDPRLDPIVRVQARELRARLAQYYAEVAQPGELIIELPKGSYVAEFHLPTASAEVGTSLPAPTREARRWRIPALALAGLVLVALGVWLIPRGTESARPTMAQITIGSTLASDPAISPDGKLIAYVGARANDDRLSLWLEHRGAGEPTRIFEGSAADPSFAPDGSQIVFRSEDDKGIYVISAFGGEARKIAPDGRRPRFSPDGKRVVFFRALSPLLATGTTGAGRIFVVPATGGTVEEIQTNLALARAPLWAPDGRNLLIRGMAASQGPDGLDWWVVPLDGGPGVKTGIAELLKQHDLNQGAFDSSATWRDWFVISAASKGTSVDLWKIPLSTRTWTASGRPNRITFGTNGAITPSISNTGELVFASGTSQIKVWEIPVDVQGHANPGKMRALPVPGFDVGFPGISLDGRRAVAYSLRPNQGPNKRQIWTFNFANDSATPLSVPDGDWPSISRDGSKVAYRRSAADKRSLHIVDLDSGTSAQVCDDCGNNPVWSPDARSLIYTFAGSARESIFGRLDLASRQKSTLLHHAGYSLFAPAFSQVKDWIAFHARVDPSHTRIFGVRFNGSATEGPWVPITDGDTLDSIARFSPDGKLIYFLSDRDGTPCLWSQQVVPESMHRVGAPFPVTHFHNPRLSIRELHPSWWGLSVGEGRILIPLEEKSSGIWMTKLR